METRRVEVNVTVKMNVPNEMGDNEVRAQIRRALTGELTSMFTDKEITTSIQEI